MNLVDAGLLAALACLALAVVLAAAVPAGVRNLAAGGAVTAAGVRHRFAIAPVPQPIPTSNTIDAASAKSPRLQLRRSMACTIGIPKAAVLPVPVWAWAMTSLPFSSSGIVSTCTGVGSSNPIRSIALRIGSSIPSELKS